MGYECRSNSRLGRVLQGSDLRVSVRIPERSRSGLSCQGPTHLGSFSSPPPGFSRRHSMALPPSILCMKPQCMKPSPTSGLQEGRTDWTGFLVFYRADMRNIVLAKHVRSRCPCNGQARSEKKWGIGILSTDLLTSLLCVCAIFSWPSAPLLLSRLRGVF